MDKITVIIPVYNRADLIEKAIQSVKDQTHTDFNCILVNDYSTDNSIQTIEKLIAGDDRFSILNHTVNKGVGAARNTGIQATATTYISFLDSDDFYHKDFLFESHELLKNNASKPDLILTGCIYYYDDAFTNIKEFIPKTPDAKRLKIKYPFIYDRGFGTGNGLVLSKKIFDKYGLFDERLKAAGDTDFFIRIENLDSFKIIEKPLIYINRTGGEHLSRNWSKLAEAYEHMIVKNHSIINGEQLLKNLWYYKLMWLSYRANNKKLARKCLSHLNFNGKAMLLATIYEAFPKNLAISLHKKISG